MLLFKKIFAAWGILVFLATLILLYPFFLFNFLIFRKDPEIHSFNLRRAWGKILLFAFCIRIRKHENAFIEPGRTYIFISNHRSMLDIIICNALIPQKFVFLAKNELVKIPLFGHIIKKATVQVNRKSNFAKMDSYQKTKEKLEQGYSVLLFPEGTRNKTVENLSQFRNGAFKMAYESGSPVIVITLWKTSVHMPGNFELKPGVVDYYTDGAFYADPENPDPVKSLREKCRELMDKNIRLNP